MKLKAAHAVYICLAEPLKIRTTCLTYWFSPRNKKFMVNTGSQFILSNFHTEGTPLSTNMINYYKECLTISNIMGY